MNSETFNIQNFGAEEASNVNPKLYSPLTLAYIGDAVFELYVRLALVKDANRRVNDLHKSAIKLVSAKSQAEFMKKIISGLTPDEHAVFKRGRNAKSTSPKNTPIQIYKIATGLEALVGFLFLSGQRARLLEVLSNISSL